MFATPRGTRGMGQSAAPMADRIGIRRCGCRGWSAAPPAAGAPQRASLQRPADHRCDPGRATSRSLTIHEAWGRDLLDVSLAGCRHPSFVTFNDAVWTLSSSDLAVW